MKPEIRPLSLSRTLGDPALTIRNDAGAVVARMEPGQEHYAAAFHLAPRLLRVAIAYLRVLQSADNEHPDFLDSGADSLDFMRGLCPPNLEQLIQAAAGNGTLVDPVLPVATFTAAELATIRAALTYYHSDGEIGALEGAYEVQRIATQNGSAAALEIDEVRALIDRLTPAAASTS